MALPTEEELVPCLDLSGVVPPWCLKYLEGDHERMLRGVDEHEHIARDAPVEHNTDPIFRRNYRQYLRLTKKLVRLPRLQWACILRNAKASSDKRRIQRSGRYWTRGERTSGFANRQVLPWLPPRLSRGLKSTLGHVLDCRQHVTRTSLPMLATSPRVGCTFETETVIGATVEQILSLCTFVSLCRHDLLSKRSSECDVVRRCVCVTTVFPRHRSSGRPQRWAIGRQRGLWPADNESQDPPRTGHKHAGTSGEQPLEVDDVHRKEESGVPFPPSHPVRPTRGAPWESTPP